MLAVILLEKVPIDICRVIQRRILEPTTTNSSEIVSLYRWKYGSVDIDFIDKGIGFILFGFKMSIRYTDDNCRYKDVWNLCFFMQPPKPWYISKKRQDVSEPATT